jgi:hypothetical protein
VAASADRAGCQPPSRARFRPIYSRALAGNSPDRGAALPRKALDFRGIELGIQRAIGASRYDWPTL